MELRKDPITRSWVMAGHPERDKVRPDPCPLCPENRIETQTLLALPPEGKWQVRVYPHFRPLYRIEGDPGRSAEGIYDRMAAVGAHEIVVETPDHTRMLAQMSDEEIERVLDAWARRIADLKRDARFKYVTVFKNQGEQSGEEWPHAHSQITATTLCRGGFCTSCVRRANGIATASAASFATFCARKCGRPSAWWTTQGIITRCARTLRACRTKFGCCRARTIINMKCRLPANSAAIWPLCSDARCAVCCRLRRVII